MKSNQPRRPAQMPDYAEACLQALAAQGLGTRISLGGAFGLSHYFEYRSTHDVDAWWAGSPSDEEMRQVVGVVQTTLGPFGEVKRHAWGDVVSIELRRSGQIVFGFQIARRSAQIEPSTPAPWVNVLLDSFSDLLAAKMTALVERGAPRDFRDVHALCRAGLTTPSEVWELWRHRQRLAGGNADTERAKLALETHLARIAVQRPLAKIDDPQQRAEAERVRNWFAEEFARAAPKI